jgi:MFS superfamily sulfate permease-like transporter
VLNAEANVEVDITGLDALEELRAELTRPGMVFALARVKQDLRDELDKYGPPKASVPSSIFPTLPTAVDAYREWARGKAAGPAGLGNPMMVLWPR